MSINCYLDRVFYSFGIKREEEPSVDYCSTIGNYIKKIAFLTASRLTDPVCKCREYALMASIYDELYPSLGGTAEKIIRFSEKSGFFAGSVLSGMVALVTSLPGIALRSITAALSKEPFLYEKGEAPEQVPGEQFSLLSWNICFVPGGYSITDGGVLPSGHRFSAVLQEIERTDADVVCLQETFDTGEAARLAERLKKQYAHIYYNIAPRAIGTSSGILVASKFAITDLSVELYPEETLVDRTKYSNKAIVSFGLQDRVRVFTTHAQHAEQPARPSEEEKRCNRKQMEILADRVRSAADRGLPVVVCGDCNIPRKHLEEIPSWQSVSDPDLAGKDRFIDGNSERIPTWDGDASCVRFYEGKTPSGALELDYIFARGVKNLRTRVGETGYDPEKIKTDPNITSDHRPLFGVITV